MPNVFIQYWGMRVMAYLGGLVCVYRAVGAVAARGARSSSHVPVVPVRGDLGGRSLPFLMNTAGWFLTESGRQPWIVQGIMLTKNGISPTVTSTYLVDQPDRLHRCCTLHWSALLTWC